MPVQVNGFVQSFPFDCCPSMRTAKVDFKQNENFVNRIQIATQNKLPGKHTEGHLHIISLIRSGCYCWHRKTIINSIIAHSNPVTIQRIVDFRETSDCQLISEPPGRCLNPTGCIARVATANPSSPRLLPFVVHSPSSRYLQLACIITMHRQWISP